MRTSAFGVTLPHPIGLAAGFDKNGIALEGLENLGFAYVEVGTVTPKPQPGNDRPRLFRVQADSALVNRLGFNSLGANEVAKNLERYGGKMPYGVNLGKNKTTPNELAWTDFRDAAKALRDFGAYFAINVSSPNTPGLRALQTKADLTRIVDAVREAAPNKRIYVKLSPDQPDEELSEIADLAQTEGWSGLIATNTTVSRAGLTAPIAEAGGLSGKPLASRAAQVAALLKRPRLEIVAVGGIFTGEDVASRIQAGAAACQIYTSFVYRGAGTVRLLLEEHPAR